MASMERLSYETTCEGNLLCNFAHRSPVMV